MEPKDAQDATNMEVAEVVAVEPLSEASVTEVSEAVPGYAVVESDVSVPAAPYEPGNEVAPHRNGKLRHVLECMLFVSSEPMTTKQLADVLELEESRVQEAIDSLEEALDSSSGLQLMRLAGGYQLCTRPEFADYCAMALQPAKKKLSKAALETLAVVAYRQPCTMPEVEAVRGVSVDGVMKTLMERGLVKEAGRKQTPGRPILYATTPEFLEYFGLNDISELPDIDMLAVEEIKALEAQRELFEEEALKTANTEDSREDRESTLAPGE